MKLRAARVSLHAKSGCEMQCVADVYIKPNVAKQYWVIDYRFSGLRETKIERGVTMEEAHEIVHDICDGKMLIGKNLNTDLEHFEHEHPYDLRFDIESVYTRRNGTPIRLDLFVRKIWNADIQQGSHDSIIDARYQHKHYKLYKNHEKFYEKFFSIQDEFLSHNLLLCGLLICIISHFIMKG